MIVDVQTHIWQHPGHLSEQFVREVAGGHDQGRLTPGDWSFDINDHWRAAQPVDCSIVSAFCSRQMDVEVPNQYVADYVNAHPEKLIGFAAVDPHDERACHQLEYCVQTLGMKGLTLSPPYQNFHPVETRAMFLYEAANELKIPVLLHLGGSFSSSSLLKFSLPMLVEDMILEFPELRIVIGHMGHPWTVDTTMLLRKHPNVYADISGMADKPWQFYNAVVTAMEYGAMDKLLFGSDWPFSTPARAMEAVYTINQLPQGTNLPSVARELLRAIVQRDSLSLLGIEMGDSRPEADDAQDAGDDSAADLQAVPEPEPKPEAAGEPQEQEDEAAAEG